MLGERIAVARRRVGMTQVELAVELGDRYDKSMISHVENGRTALLLDGAVKAAEALKVSLDYLVGLTDDPTPAAELSRTANAKSRSTARPEPASWPDYVIAPFMQDVRTAAGTGALVFHEAAEMRVAFHRSVLPSWLQHDRLICVQAVGNSMEPTIHDGDLVALDHSRNEPLDGQIFVVRTDDGLVVKRLRRRGTLSWTLTSDNPAHPPRPAATEDRVIGRVAWSGPPRRASSNGPVSPRLPLADDRAAADAIKEATAE